MPKILYLVTSGNLGGAPRYAILSAEKSKKENFEVLIGSGERDWLEKEAEKRGIKFFFFKNLKRSLNPFWSLLFIFEFRKFLKKEKINIISFNGSNALFGVLSLWGLKEKPKTIFTVHGMSYLSPGFKKSFLAKTLAWLAMKILLPMAEEIIFVSNYDKDLAEKLKLVKKNQGKVIYNEIEKINFLNREEARRELKLPENKIIIGTITRLEYAKNNEMLIEAFTRLNSDKVICVIIGDGPDRNKYKLPNNVFLLGEIPEAAKYLKAFDVFAMTSRYEGMPYALLEAISADIPIIATKVGGIPEILEGKGILIEPENVEELKKNLLHLLSRGLEDDHNRFEKY